MSATEETLALLRSIDRSLKQLVGALGSSRPQGGAAVVAADADLDGQYGDPKVPFNPRAWKGQSFKGRKFSECPAEFLDALAEAFDYLAGKAEENGETLNNNKPAAPYKRRDAARARGWAVRVRAGKGATPATAAVVPASWGADVADDDGDPFAGAGVGASDIGWSR